MTSVSLSHKIQPGCCAPLQPCTAPSQRAVPRGPGLRRPKGSSALGTFSRDQHCRVGRDRRVGRTVRATTMDGSATHQAEAPVRPKTFVLGLTGSIGMGKSTVSSMFREEGVPVWDADATVYELYGRGGAAVPLVGAAFPGVVQDGAINRAALSAQVLGNEAAMKQLESLVHPLVSRSRLDFLDTVRSRGLPLAVLDIPLLFETGGPGPRRHGTDAVAVVSAEPEQQRARVLSRPGMSEEKLAAILGRQVPDAEKRRLADFVIDTSTSLEATRAEVAELVRRLSAREGV